MIQLYWYSNLTPTQMLLIATLYLLLRMHYFGKFYSIAGIFAITALVIAILAFDKELFVQE
jgi:hypothetical protein